MRAILYRSLRRALPGKASTELAEDFKLAKVLDATDISYSSATMIRLRVGSTRIGKTFYKKREAFTAAFFGVVCAERLANKAAPATVIGKQRKTFVKPADCADRRRENPCRLST